MQVRVLKECYCTFLRRRVQPGEVIEVTAVPEGAITAGLVELITPIPENCPDLYPD
jgi:hypothetical protein